MNLKEIEKRYAEGYRNGFLIEVTQMENDMEWLMDQVEEFERYKKYVMYFAGKDKVNDIRFAMQDRELD